MANVRPRPLAPEVRISRDASVRSAGKRFLFRVISVCPKAHLPRVGLADRIRVGQAGQRDRQARDLRAGGWSATHPSPCPVSGGTTDRLGPVLSIMEAR